MKPWGGIDPNSQHQLWSRWTFEIFSTKRQSLTEVLDNARRWLRQGFGSVGHVRVSKRIWSWVIIAEVEGMPAHDPDFVASVRRQFQHNFVELGWGRLGWGRVKVEILAGDKQDGNPPSQLVVIPTVKVDVSCLR